MSVVQVVVPWRGNWYTDAVIGGLRSTLATAGHDVIVHVLPYSPPVSEQVTALLEASLAEPTTLGAVVTGFRLHEPQCTRLLAAGKPVIVTGGKCPWLPSVRIDDLLAARLATEHLLALGHRTIAHVAGVTVRSQDLEVWSDRVRGYTDAMSAAGLEDLARVRPSEPRFDDARMVGMELLSDADRPTAIFVATDELAYGIHAAARDLHLTVPGDVSIISIDDHPDAERHRMTTIGQVPADTGTAAARRLLGHTSADLQIMPITLIERDTTGAHDPQRPRRSRLARLFRRR